MLRKARLWEEHPGRPSNEWQRTILSCLLDGFEEKITSSKWAELAKCSQDTTSRDLEDLIQWSSVARNPAGGRSTSDTLIEPTESPDR